MDFVKEDLWSKRKGKAANEAIKKILSVHPDWVNERHPSRKALFLFEFIFTGDRDDRDEELVAMFLSSEHIQMTDKILELILNEDTPSFLIQAIKNPVIRSSIYCFTNGSLTYAHALKNLKETLADIETATAGSPEMEIFKKYARNYEMMVELLRKETIAFAIKTDNDDVVKKLGEAGVVIDRHSIDPLKNPNIFSYLSDSLVSDPSSPPSSVGLRSSEDTSSPSSPEADERAEFLQDLAAWRYKDALEKECLQAQIGVWGDANRKISREVASISQDIKHK